MSIAPPAWAIVECRENAAQIAIWKCDPDLHRCVRASANDGYLTLTGTVATERQRSSIEAAVLGLGGDTSRLTNMIEVIGATQNEEERPTPPMAVWCRRSPPEHIWKSWIR